jgi:hypothetical protein
VETKGLVFVKNTNNTPINGESPNAAISYKDKYFEMSGETKRMRKLNIIPSTNQPAFIN